MSGNALLSLVKGAQKKYARNTSRTINLKEGKTRVRILQASPEAKFWQELGGHWIKTEKNGKPIAVVGCRDEVYDEPCEICTAIDKATRAAEDDDTLAIIKEWKARRSVLMNALIRSGNDASEDPQVLEMTPTTFSTICSMIEEYMPDYGNVLDPNEGMDVVIERKGKGLATEYTVLPAFKAKPVPKEAMGKLIDLEEFVEKEYFRGDETKALNAISNMMGIDVGQRAIANKAAATAGLLTGSTGSVAGAEVEDADVQEVDPTDVENEVPPPPKKAAKAAAKPAAKAAQPEPAAEPETDTDDFGTDLNEDDLDDVLGELDDLDKI
ncbi:MAG: hypothetical protein LAT55_12625 [Opitutales bacterium]|nr:hypothetical protein [Opitutales bacterium]